jgi:O-methyltransferase domain
MLFKHLYKSKIMRLITSKWLAKPLYSAIELNLPELITTKPISVILLSEKIQTKPELLYRLLRTLSSFGVFKELNNKEFISSPMSTLLREEELRSMILMFQSEWHDRVWNKLTENIKTGKSGFELAFNCTAFDYLNNNSGVAEIFNNANKVKSTMNKGLLNKYDFSKVKTITDIGGGSGELLLNILTKNNNINGQIYDLKYVEKSAKININSKNLNDRCIFFLGNFFDKINLKPDVFILSNILHDWNDEKSIEILKNCYDAMGEHTKLLIIEMVVPQNNKFSISKLMDLEVLLMGNGRERTMSEFKSLLKTAKLQIHKVMKSKNNFKIIECAKYRPHK